jgi:hypothetical protein
LFLLHMSGLASLSIPFLLKVFEHI